MLAVAPLAVLANSANGSIAGKPVQNQILQAEATEQVQAEPHKRTEERLGYRNGTYLCNLIIKFPHR